MDGVVRCSRYAFGPNRLHYCGPDANREIFAYIKEGAGDLGLEALLQKFRTMYPYLSYISRINNISNPFDDRVVEAYWIGNKLLEKCEKKDMIEVINRLQKRGLPKSIAEKKIEQLPEKLKPHHNANVLFVGVGKLTGSVPTTIKNMQNCRISSGIVIDEHTVKTKVLQADFSLKEEIKPFNPLPSMHYQKGDKVALHWNTACYTLSEEQDNNLEKYNAEILEIVRRSLNVKS